MPVVPRSPCLYLGDPNLGSSGPWVSTQHPVGRGTEGQGPGRLRACRRAGSFRRGRGVGLSWRGKGRAQGWGVNRAGASAGPLLLQTPRPTLVGSSMSGACLCPAAPSLQTPAPAEPRSSGVPQQQGRPSWKRQGAPLDAQRSGREDVMQYITGLGGMRAARGQDPGG